MKLISYLASSAILLASAAAAASGAAIADPIRAGVESLNARASLESVRDAPVAGLKEVRADGQVLYFTADGEYLIVGDIYRVSDRTNITEASRSRVRADALAKSDPSTHIRFGAKDAKDTVYVFTDTTCVYCQRFHKEVAELNAAGVAVEYLAWPRSGTQPSEVLTAMENVWCSADPAQGYASLIAGGSAPRGIPGCTSPVKEHLALGEQLGVRGTPAIFTTDGRQIGGYVPAKTVLQALHAPVAN